MSIILCSVSIQLLSSAALAANICFVLLKFGYMVHCILHAGLHGGSSFLFGHLGCPPCAHRLHTRADTWQQTRTRFVSHFGVLRVVLLTVFLYAFTKNLTVNSTSLHVSAAFEVPITDHVCRLGILLQVHIMTVIKPQQFGQACRSAGSAKVWHPSLRQNQVLLFCPPVRFLCRCWTILRYML